MKQTLYKILLIVALPLLSNNVFAGLINDISTETVQENISVNGFNWTASYDISFTNQDLLIDVDVFLAGFEPGAALRDIWKDGIESIWSNAFDIFDGTYYYDTVFNVDWLDSPLGSDHFVFVHEGDGAVNLQNWYTGNPSGQGFDKQGRVAAHEFGHMIGLLDEYSGGASQIIRPDSIMGSQLSSPQADHYTDFTNWLSLNSGANSLSLVADNGLHHYVEEVPEPTSLVLFLFASIYLVRRRQPASQINKPLAIA